MFNFTFNSQILAVVARWKKQVGLKLLGLSYDTISNVINTLSDISIPKQSSCQNFVKVCYWNLLY